MSLQGIAAGYRVAVFRQAEAGRLQLTVCYRERQIQPKLSVCKVDSPNRTDAANVSFFYCSLDSKGGERSCSLQRGQAKSSESKIVRFEPDGTLQGRKRYSQDAFVISTSLASTVDQLAQLPQHKPVSGNIHVEPQRLRFCE